MSFKYGGVSKDDLNNYERFPEGKYEFFIDSIREMANPYSGVPELEIVLKPTDITMQRHGKVWHRINLDNEWTMINIGRFLAAMGEDPERPGEVHFQRYEGESLTARIKHKTGKDGKTYVNAMLLPREAKIPEHSKDSSKMRERARSHEYAPASSLAQEWDGESGRSTDPDDIPF